MTITDMKSMVYQLALCGDRVCGVRLAAREPRSRDSVGVGEVLSMTLEDHGSLPPGLCPRVRGGEVLMPMDSLTPAHPCVVIAGTRLLLLRSLLAAAPPLLLVQIVLFQEFGPELLWRRGNVRPALWRKVHEIPVRPHRVEVIRCRLSSPEMKNLSVQLPKHMHHRPLHIIRVSLALVIRLVGRLRTGHHWNLRPSTSLSPRIDSC